MFLQNLNNSKYWDEVNFLAKYILFVCINIEIYLIFLQYKFYLNVYYKLCAICCTLLSGEDMGNIYKIYISHVLLARRAQWVGAWDHKILSPHLFIHSWKWTDECAWMWMVLCTADETVYGPALHLGGGFSSAIEWMSCYSFCCHRQERVKI